MKIETKYSLNDTVWYIQSNKVKKSAISSVTYVNDNGNVNVSYNANEDKELTDDELFVTKDELLKSL